MSDHAELIARLEAAEAGSPELSAVLLCALIAPAGSYVEQSPINGAWCIYTEGNDRKRLWEARGADHALKTSCPTRSLDAALALAERVLPGCFQGVSQNVHSSLWFAWLGYSDNGEPRLHSDAFGKTASISICIAILKATGGVATSTCGTKRSEVNNTLSNHSKQ